MNETLTIFLTIFITIIVAAPTIYYYRQYLIKSRIERANAESDLLQAIKNAFIFGNINTTKDLIDIIEGFPKFNLLRFNYPWDLKKMAQQLKYATITSVELKDVALGTKLHDLLLDIDKFIEEEMIKAPFENAPAIEKNLLIDILELSGQKTNDVFRDKLNRLSEQIITRQSTMDKLATDNAESLKKTKLSVTLAIIFFLISTGLTIFSLLK